MFNEEIMDLLRDSFDVELLQEHQEPETEDGHLTYSIPGKTFARDGSGGEYILLDDGTVGYWAPRVSADGWRRVSATASPCWSTAPGGWMWQMPAITAIPLRVRKPSRS